MGPTAEQCVQCSVPFLLGPDSVEERFWGWELSLVQVSENVGEEMLSCLWGVQSMKRQAFGGYPFHGLCFIGGVSMA